MSAFCSHFLYPNKNWKSGDNGEDEASGCGDGKYELLSVANKHMVEEIKNVMSKSKSCFIPSSHVLQVKYNVQMQWSKLTVTAEVSGNSNDTLLAGSLAKALCCILKIRFFAEYIKKINTCGNDWNKKGLRMQRNDMLTST